MKQIYILITILFFNFINLTAQTVTVTGSCDPTDTDGDYTLSTNINGRPSYVYSSDGSLTIQWSGTRWELVQTSDPSIIGMYNDANTMNPPASSFSPWIAALCDPAGNFSGDGTYPSIATVTVTGSCDSTDTDGDYTLSTNINGRPSYVYSSDGSLTIQWSGTRWELVQTSDPSIIGMYNDANTMNPPASSFSPWIAGLCDPAGNFTGNGTSDAVLSINEVELVTVNIKIYPNPVIEYISISGLEKEINFEIYNTLGAKIQKGKTSNDERIDIQNLNIGLYFLKFDNGNTMKFIKE